MNEFLSILTSLWQFMKDNGFTFSLGEQTFSLSFAVVACGVFAISVVIDLIHKIWWYE